MVSSRTGVPVDPPAGGVTQPTDSCAETWDDEVGCLGDWPHECVTTGKHTTHRCRDCDAMVIEDQP